MGIGRCSHYDGNNQCKATKKLTTCVLSTVQGGLLEGPEKVIVELCPKHFILRISRKLHEKHDIQDATTVRKA